MFRRTLPCFHGCLLPLVLSLSTTGNHLDPFSLHIPLKYLYMLVRSSTYIGKFHIVTKYSPSGPPYVNIFLVLQHLKLDIDFQRWYHRYQVLENSYFPQPAVHSFTKVMWG